MDSLQHILILAGVIFLFLVIILLKKYMQNPFGFLLILPCLGLLFFGYAAFSKYQLHRYYEQALNAPAQIRYCGIFAKWVVVEKPTRHSIIQEKVFLFQNDRQGFLFSNSLRTRQQFPELQTLKEQAPVCFQFSPEYKDEEGRYILTAFEKQK
ncbi:hypothetical protein [Acinetobacter tianfuensis]|uniref:Uncharacterized protein n=1 Tax=Acinetobacter tianfuensis TaxID=2419603 RepID=A0A3A8EGC4_9GAMM|nr:hypothetical protein [Acinetobacter tianfuensis]RKG29830.1 hypothetical protein D7V32_13325 [Acinetobacter tianfuensis]